MVVLSHRIESSMIDLLGTVGTRLTLRPSVQLFMAIDWKFERLKQLIKPSVDQSRFDQSLRQSVAESHGGHVVELAKLSKTKHCDEKIEELIVCFKDAWCLKCVNRFTKYFDQAARLSRDILRSAPEINCFELLGVCAVNVEVYQIPLERFWWNVLCGLSLRQDQINEYWLHVARFTIVKFLYNTNALVYSILPCIVVIVAD